MESPVLYTARFFAEDMLMSGEVVPVRVSMHPPVAPLPYLLEHTAETLLPERYMLGEWPHLSRTYWAKLDAIGPESIANELRGISERHDGLPLALVDYEDLVKGHRSPRIVFAAWWEAKTGQAVPELLDTGQALHYSELHKQVQPKKPKTHDARWSDDKLRDWPLSHADIEAWIGERHWQFARTSPGNPHEYTHRDWGHEQMFLRVALHIREHGRQQTYGRAEYSVLDVGDCFYWTMGDPLATTVILNRKYHDPQKQARLAEERTGKSREELGLVWDPSAEVGAAPEKLAAVPGLFGIDQWRKHDGRDEAGSALRPGIDRGAGQGV
jgi:hypothetical protein